MTGLPSELIEPLFADTFSWYLRDYAASPQTDGDAERLRSALDVINRMSIVNQTDGVNGVHAGIASMNLRRLTENMLAEPAVERARFLEDLVRRAGPQP